MPRKKLFHKKFSYFYPRNIKTTREILERIIVKRRRCGTEKNNGSYANRDTISLEQTKENRKLFEQIGFRQAPMHIHAEVSWQINIDRSEIEIVMDMKKNTLKITEKLRNREYFSYFRKR